MPFIVVDINDPNNTEAYSAPRTPLARVLESPQVTLETKGRLVVEKERLNPFALKRDIEAGLKQIARMRQLEA
jgi:hypothetical protein